MWVASSGRAANAGFRLSADCTGRAGAANGVGVGVDAINTAADVGPLLSAAATGRARTAPDRNCWPRGASFLSCGWWPHQILTCPRGLRCLWRHVWGAKLRHRRVGAVWPPRRGGLACAFGPTSRRGHGRGERFHIIFEWKTKPSIEAREEGATATARARLILGQAVCIGSMTYIHELGSGDVPGCVLRE